MGIGLGVQPLHLFARKRTPIEKAKADTTPITTSTIKIKMAGKQIALLALFLCLGGTVAARVLDEDTRFALILSDISIDLTISAAFGAARQLPFG